MRRLPLKNSAGETLSDANVAVEIQLADGRSDLIVASDVENPMKLASAGSDGIFIQPDWNIQFTGDLVWLRRDKRGGFERASICRGTSLKMEKSEIALEGKMEFAEFEFKGSRPVRVQDRKPK